MDADDPFGPDGFVLTFPVWVVGRPDRTVAGLLQGRYVGGATATPLFTDEDLARTFLERSPAPGHVVMPIFEASALLGLLGALVRQGLTHVVIDPSGARGKSCPIALFRDKLARALDEADEG
jgi:hypothetical protein